MNFIQIKSKESVEEMAFIWHWTSSANWKGQRVTQDTDVTRVTCNQPPFLCPKWWLRPEGFRNCRVSGRLLRFTGSGIRPKATPATSAIFDSSRTATVQLLDETATRKRQLQLDRSGSRYAVHTPQSRVFLSTKIQSISCVTGEWFLWPIRSHRGDFSWFQSHFP